MAAGIGHIAALGIFLVLSFFAAFFDAKYLVIPDRINLGIFCSGLAASFYLGVVGPGSALAASLFGSGLLFLLQIGFRAYRGYDGLGLGDVKFVGGAATWIGVEGLPFSLLIASMTALAWVLVRRVVDGTFDLRRRLPFGPFLVIGAVAVAAPQLLIGTSTMDLLEPWLHFVLP